MQAFKVILNFLCPTQTIILASGFTAQAVNLSAYTAKMSSNGNGVNCQVWGNSKFAEMKRGKPRCAIEHPSKSAYLILHAISAHRMLTVLKARM